MYLFIIFTYRSMLNSSVLDIETLRSTSKVSLDSSIFNTQWLHLTANRTVVVVDTGTRTQVHFSGVGKDTTYIREYQSLEENLPHGNYVWAFSSTVCTKLADPSNRL
jgi:hypothetical protein